VESIQRNKELKESIQKRLQDNETLSKELRDQRISKITSADRKELMELECKVGVLEVGMF
jgi:hypothetical protein